MYFDHLELEPWKMYFDGAINQNGSGIGVLLISLKWTHIPFSGRLNFPATDNATEYEACIMGLQATLGLRVKELEVYGDSALIISPYEPLIESHRSFCSLANLEKQEPSHVQEEESKPKVGCKNRQSNCRVHSLRLVS